MISFKLVILKNKIDKLGQYPINLRLTGNGEQRYISTKIRCKSGEWDDDKEIIKSRPDRIKLNLELKEFKNSIESKYNNLNVDTRKVISISEYMEQIKVAKTKRKSSDFFYHIDSKIKELRELGTISTINTARYFNDCRNSVKSFIGKESLEFSSINIEWIRKYEKFLRMNDCKDSSISVRMRAIRTIFNLAIADKDISAELYPFSRNKQEQRLKYSINSLNTDTVYRAISIEDFQKIIDFDTDRYPSLKFTKDLFLFSYYTGGMNFVDMSLLLRENITKDNRIRYTRSKTSGNFNISVLDSTKAILDYYEKNNIGTKYVFPILLSDNLTPTQITNRKKKLITKFNKDLKEIGRLCEIDFDLTSYVARHSFATHLFQKSVPVEIISQMLGHKNVITTQVYLKKFGNEVLDNAMKYLIQ